MSLLAPAASLYRSRQTHAICASVDLAKGPADWSEWVAREIQAGYCLDAPHAIPTGGMDSDTVLPSINGTVSRGRMS